MAITASGLYDNPVRSSFLRLAIETQYGPFVSGLTVAGWPPAHVYTNSRNLFGEA
jgi:hypothetical protein